MSSRVFASEVRCPCKCAAIFDPPGSGQLAAGGEPIQQVGELQLAVGARAALAQDLHGAIPVVRLGTSQGVQQHQGPLALPEVAADLLAVLLRVRPQVQQVVGDLKGRAEVPAEGLQRRQPLRVRRRRRSRRPAAV